MILLLIVIIVMIIILLLLLQLIMIILIMIKIIKARSSINLPEVFFSVIFKSFSFFSFELTEK